MTKVQIQALQAVCDAVTDAVAVAGPMGAPSGVVFAALQTQGCSLSQYTGIIGLLVKVGRLRKSGDMLFVPDVSEKPAHCTGERKAECATCRVPWCNYNKPC